MAKKKYDGIVKTSERLNKLAATKSLDDLDGIADENADENEEEFPSAEHLCLIDGIDLCHRAMKAGRPIYHISVPECESPIKVVRHKFCIGTEDEIAAALEKLPDADPEELAEREEG